MKRSKKKQSRHVSHVKAKLLSVNGVKVLSLDIFFHHVCFPVVWSVRGQSTCERIAAAVRKADYVLWDRIGIQKKKERNERGYPPSCRKPRALPFAVSSHVWVLYGRVPAEKKTRVSHPAPAAVATAAAAAATASPRLTEHGARLKFQGCTLLRCERPRCQVSRGVVSHDARWACVWRSRLGFEQALPVYFCCQLFFPPGQKGPSVLSCKRSV